jgi:quercetin dioxygenase-like cupin family protein
MTAKLTPGAGAPDEPAAVQLILDDGMTPRVWSNNPGDTYAEHRHDYDKVVYCVAGDVTFRVTGEELVLGQGDRLDIEADTDHSAVVGAAGVRCVEGARGRE